VKTGMQTGYMVIAVSSSQLAAGADRARRMEQEDGRSGRFEACSSVVIGACVEVHRVLGPGLLESPACW